jgi:hypothetical protein
MVYVIILVRKIPLNVHFNSLHNVCYYDIIYLIPLKIYITIIDNIFDITIPTWWYK